MPPRKKPTPAPEPQRAVLHDNVTLLEVSESWILDMVMADQTAGRMVAARVGDCVAMIVPGQADALLARLRKLGHTPRVEEA
jgi:hypothetical protein